MCITDLIDGFPTTRAVGNGEGGNSPPLPPILADIEQKAFIQKVLNYQMDPPPTQIPPLDFQTILPPWTTR